MTLKKPCPIRTTLSKILPVKRIRALAEKMGAVTRQRKVDIVSLIAVLVLGGRSGPRRTLESIRRSYERLTGHTLARSSFYDRLNERLAETLRLLVDEGLERAAVMQPKLRLSFLRLREILAVDSTILRLHPALADTYPGAWAHHSPAALKLTVAVNIVDRGPKRIQIAPGSRHDVHMLKPGPWVKRRLIIADLAFTRCATLSQIERYQGFFLARLKKNGSPLIRSARVPSHRLHEGQKLRDVVADLDGDTADFDVDLAYRIRRQGRWVNRTFPCRLVGVRDAEGHWRFYVTNLSRRSICPRRAAGLYAARWEIELLFREMKTVLSADQLRYANESVVLCLVYAALLAILAARRLHAALLKSAQTEHHRAPLDRFARLFVTYADCLLDAFAVVLHKRRTHLRHLAEILARQALDPNIYRVPLGQRDPLIEGAVRP